MVEVIVSRLGLDSASNAGTTSALVFGAHYADAVDTLFTAASRVGLRITSGLVVSDRATTYEGAAYGYHSATGHVPTHLEHLRASGEDLPQALFMPTPQPLREDLY